MKRKEVIIGIAIAMVILIATLIIHNFIFELPHALVSSLIIFSALLFTLCIIGEKKRKQQEESQKPHDK
jgi:predicted tellurium resistance membrane protein TerC